MRPCGGDEEVRTPDPLRARQVLSQLSYTPMRLSPLSLFEFVTRDALKTEQHLTLSLPKPFITTSSLSVSCRYADQR